MPKILSEGLLSGNIQVSGLDLSKQRNFKKESLDTKSVEQLKRMKCSGCSSKKTKDAGEKLEPRGNRNPIFYVLTGIPTEADKSAKEFLSGMDGLLFEQYLPYEFNNNIRIGGCACCYSDVKEYQSVSKYRSQVQKRFVGNLMHSCHNILRKDIEESAPFAIIGLGTDPMNRLLELGASIIRARGRRYLIRFGEWTGWYFPVLHPRDILDNQKTTKAGNKIKGSYEYSFENDLKNIAEFYYKSRKIFPSDYLVEKGTHMEGVSYVLKGDKSLRRIERKLQKFLKEPYLAIDFETQGLSPYVDEPLLLTISIGTWGDAFAFPLDHPQGWEHESQRNRAYNLIAKFLRRYRGILIAHNFNFEFQWMQRIFGKSIIKKSKHYSDTMMLAELMNQTIGFLSLNDLVRQYMGFNLKGLYNLNKGDMKNAPINKVLPYNALDVKFTYRLYELLLEEMEDPSNDGMTDWLIQHQMESVMASAFVQAEGVCPNILEVKKHQKELGKKLSPVMGKIKSLSEVKRFNRRYNREYNPHSDTTDNINMFSEVIPQAKVFIHNEKRKKGFSVDVNSLKLIPESMSELPALILEMRGIETLKTTFVDALQGYMKDDGLLHPNFNSLFTSTSRWSSDSPNAQNYPARGEKGKVRSVIGIPSNYKMVAVDYAQLESRVLAAVSGDETFIKYTIEGYDVHTEFSDFFKEDRNGGEQWIEEVCIDQGVERHNEGAVKKACRFVAKNSFVFASFYKSSAYSIAKIMHLDPELIEEAQNILWDRFPDIKKWQNEQIDFYNKNGYGQSVLGRKFTGILSPNDLVNYPIQSTGSDLLIDSCYRLGRKEIQACINVHDELIFYVRDDEMFDRRVRRIAKEMIHHNIPCEELARVPMEVEVEVSDTHWAGMKFYGVFKDSNFYPDDPRGVDSGV